MNNNRVNVRAHRSVGNNLIRPNFGQVRSTVASATTPKQANQDMRTYAERVKSYVRVAACAMPEVTGAFVSDDGCHVYLTAENWTESLSRVGAELVVALIRELKPIAPNWIEGGFTERYVPPSVGFERVK